MARTKVVIDEALLRRVIKETEEAKHYTARSALFNDVSSAYNQRITGSMKPLNGQLVYLRVRELGIELKTPVGKRGRAAGFVNTGVRVPRADKLAGSKDAKATFSAIRDELKLQYEDGSSAKRFLPLVDKMESGSLKAAIKMKCLSCANYDPQEVKACQIILCPLLPFRPYKTK